MNRPISESLRPLIEASLESIEVHRRLPQELVDAMYDAGIMRTRLPSAAGGLDLPLRDYLDFVFELSRIDASVGWIAVAQSGCDLSIAPEALSELAAERLIVSCGHGTTGQARRVDGGFRLSGEWNLASGAPWATHFALRARPLTGEGLPETDPEGGGPVLIECVVPQQAAEYIDDWFAVGLRGAASGTFRLDDVLVEQRFTTEPRVSSAASASALGYVRSAGVCAVLLGTAQGAVDAFTEIAAAKHKRTNSFAGRAAIIGTTQEHQVAVAEADAMIRGAREASWSAAACLDEAVRDGDRQRIDEFQVLADATVPYAARDAKQATGLIFDIAGTDAVIMGRGIERRFRDVFAVAGHAGVRRADLAPTGELLLAKQMTEQRARKAATSNGG